MGLLMVAAEKVGRITNNEVRDFAAFVLDEVHSWRCGLFDPEGECDAVAEAFAPFDLSGDMPAATTRVYHFLQPLSTFSAWYLAGPFVRWLQTLQHIDAGDGTVRWRFDAAFLRPWRFIPSPRHEYDMIARFAASRTWFDADMFIARYIVHAAAKLKNGYGTSVFFYDPTVPDTLSRACYEYSLDVLAAVAAAVQDDPDGSEMEVFAEALQEAIVLGLLWD